MLFLNERITEVTDWTYPTSTPTNAPPTNPLSPKLNLNRDPVIAVGGRVEIIKNRQM